MLMALGTFVFDLPTLAYQQLQRSFSWRHAASERVGARAAFQYVGVGEETIELAGLVAPPLTGSLASLTTLREMADEGRPLALVAGTGEVLGAFVVTNVRETHTAFFADGTPRKVEFQMTLLRTGDARADDAQVSA